MMTATPKMADSSLRFSVNENPLSAATIAAMVENLEHKRQGQREEIAFLTGDAFLKRRQVYLAMFSVWQLLSLICLIDIIKVDAKAATLLGGTFCFGVLCYAYKKLCEYTERRLDHVKSQMAASGASLDSLHDAKNADIETAKCVALVHKDIGVYLDKIYGTGRKYMLQGEYDAIDRYVRMKSSG